MCCPVYLELFGRRNMRMNVYKTSPSSDIMERFKKMDKVVSLIGNDSRTCVPGNQFERTLVICGVDFQVFFSANYLLREQITARAITENDESESDIAKFERGDDGLVVGVITMDLLEATVNMNLIEHYIVVDIPDDGRRIQQYFNHLNELALMNNRTIRVDFVVSQQDFDNDQVPLWMSDILRPENIDPPVENDTVQFHPEYFDLYPIPTFLPGDFELAEYTIENREELELFGWGESDDEDCGGVVGPNSDNEEGEQQE